MNKEQMTWKEELDYLEAGKHWDAAISFLEKAMPLYPNDSELYIRAIYLLLNLLLEEDYASFNLNHDDLAAMLKKCFDESYKRFKDIPKYLFFVGYFLGLAEWYFGQEDLSLSHQMVKKAAELEPDNPLYQWGFNFVAGNQDAVIFCKQIVSDGSLMNSLKLNGGPGLYLSEVLNNSCGP